MVNNQVIESMLNVKGVKLEFKKGLTETTVFYEAGNKIHLQSGFTPFMHVYYEILAFYYF